MKTASRIVAVLAAALSVLLAALVACSPCKLLFDVKTRSALDRFSRTDDKRLKILVHEFSPVGAGATFFNPHAVKFADDMDLTQKPPKLTPLEIRGSKVMLGRPAPEFGYVVETDFEVGIAMRDVRTQTDAVVVDVKFNLAGKETTTKVVFRLARDHVRMKMWRVVYKEFVDTQPKVPPGAEADADNKSGKTNRARKNAPAEERWVAVVNPPVEWRTRDVTEKVVLEAELDDILGPDPQPADIKALVYQVEDASTEPFHAMYHKMVDPNRRRGEATTGSKVWESVFGPNVYENRPRGNRDNAGSRTNTAQNSTTRN